MTPARQTKLLIQAVVLLIAFLAGLVFTCELLKS